MKHIPRAWFGVHFDHRDLESLQHCPDKCLSTCTRPAQTHIRLIPFYTPGDWTIWLLLRPLPAFFSKSTSQHPPACLSTERPAPTAGEREGQGKTQADNHLPLNTFSQFCPIFFPFCFFLSLSTLILFCMLYPPNFVIVRQEGRRQQEDEGECLRRVECGF